MIYSRRRKPGGEKRVSFSLIAYLRILVAVTFVSVSFSAYFLGDLFNNSRMEMSVGTQSSNSLVSAQPSLEDVLFGSLSSIPSVREEEQRRLWSNVDSNGWQPAASHRSSDWKLPEKNTNGYLMVRCNGGLNQQRSAICNAVLAARLMNATLVLPFLDANLYWDDESGFDGIYDVDRFISYLQSDVNIVRKIPEEFKRYKKHPMNPPREASIEWYTGVALQAMKRHKVLYLTPFAHRLSEELGSSAMAGELQRLRCRVNFQALRFRPEVEQVAAMVEDRLSKSGPFVAVHMRFEMDMLAFAGCVDIFSAKERSQLVKYRLDHFAAKKLESSERRKMGKCPLTPEEVGLILKALGYPNSTRVYLAAGDLFGGDRFMKPLRAMFPYVTNRSLVATANELAPISGKGKGLLGSAVDYLVCLKAAVFLPTYDGPSNFANNVMGHRRFLGFLPTIQPDRKALAPLFEARKRRQLSQSEFEKEVRRVVYEGSFGGPRERQAQESFYTNPWPDCFCKPASKLGSTGAEHLCSKMDMLQFALQAKT